MVENGQCLALRVEPRKHLLRVHSGFENLHGYLAADRLALLSEKYVRHTALAQRPDYTIRAD